MIIKRSRFLVFLLVIVALVFQSASAMPFNRLASGGGGGPTGSDAPSLYAQSMLASQSLSQVVNEFGKIKLSLDALGTLDDSGIIQVEKPDGATVRKAYLMAATTGWSSYRLQPGDVTILGNNVAWESEIANSIFSYNYWADVTAIVKPTIDAAPAGLIDIPVGEGSVTYSIDGEILAVIFDDPNQAQNHTIQLYFGAQNVAGDTFTIDFGMPLDKSDPNLVLDYSLGISYGCVTAGFCALPLQYSIVDVNGQRLTTSAGGEDDGSPQNGALITVGGIGDSNDNPPDPYATSDDPRADDELYNLVPFIDDGDSSVTIETSNPSQDDNIMFAALMMSARSIRIIDVDISLYNNPTTTQARAPYESIINFMADGIFESSNGANKLGRVRFFPSNGNAAQANIIWVERCHPNANVSGFGTNGLHVNMCDIFRDGSGPGVDYNFLADTSHQRGGGYTLAHEMGHYYYSLYDEYVGSATYDTIYHFPHSTDKAVTNSIMNSQWNALGGNFNWLNFSIPKNDTKATAQYRVYQADGWTTLARPLSDDPRDGDRAALPGRLVHPELRDVRPADNQDSPLDLPGTARSALNIVWESVTPAGLEIVPSALSLPLNAQLSSILGQNISYPNPILLLAFVHSDLMVTDMGVEAYVTLPGGFTQPIVFADDGVPPDAMANDGLYSAILGYTENGIYHFDIHFDNDANQAKFVSTAFTPTSGADGQPVPLQEPVLVDEPFLLTQSLQVSVSHVQADDHGNIPDEATPITSDNVSYPGKIDYAGDLDVFQFTTTGSSVNYVRVTNLALGANPKLRIFGTNKTTLLFSKALDPDKSEYLFVPLPGVASGTTLYAEVSDQSAASSGGFYEVSAGPRLSSDEYFDKPLFMPMIRISFP